MTEPDYDIKSLQMSDKEVLTLEDMIKILTPNELSMMASVSVKWYVRFHNETPFFLEEFRYDLFVTMKQIITERQKMMVQIQKTQNLHNEVSKQLSDGMREGFDTLKAKIPIPELKRSD